MKITRIPEAQGANPDGILARPLLEGSQSNVRIIRLAPGRALPPHRHGVSDLMLLVVAGNGELEQPAGSVPFATGALAYYTGDEELRVRNIGTVELTMLAFLAPKFAAS
jgi:mannose-6-phosphate isomerase-like protein (cupin superfamily)